MPLFSIPLSGLTAASNALSVISNNLANLNTDGFKEQSTTFRDLFYQTAGTSGGGNPIQIGNGVQVESVHSNFNDGSLDNTGVSTDMAITGSGFFVTEKTASCNTPAPGISGPTLRASSLPRTDKSSSAIQRLVVRSAQVHRLDRSMSVKA